MILRVHEFWDDRHTLEIGKDRINCCLQQNLRPRKAVEAPLKSLRSTLENLEFWTQLFPVCPNDATDANNTK